MIGAFDERQPRDDFRRGVEFKRGPPRPGAGDGEGGNEPKIAFRRGHRLDDARRAHMRHQRHGEAEMESRRIAHQRVAGRKIGMGGEGRLYVGEGGDDDAPDTFDSVEREAAVMTLHEAAHHVGLARRTERRAGFLGLLHCDQSLDDRAAIDQKRVHGLVDAVDLASQLGKRGFLLARRFRHGFDPAIGLIDKCR